METESGVAEPVERVAGVSAVASGVGHEAAFEAAHKRFEESIKAEQASPSDAVVPDEKVETSEVESLKEEAPADKPETALKPDNKAVSAGLSALKRLKVPAKLIDGMTQTELAEYGKEAALQTAEKDSLFREVGELRKQAGKSSSKSADSVKAEEPAFDMDKELQLLVGTLDEDTGKAIGGIFKNMDARSRADVSSLQSRLDEIQGSIAFGELSEKLAEDAKAGLVDRFPQLGDRKFIRSAIIPLMGKLNSDGEYTDASGVVDLPQLFLHAAKVACDEKPSPPSPSRSRAASPITDTSSVSRSRAKTLDEKMDKAFDLAVKKGLPLDQVRAAMR